MIEHPISACGECPMSTNGSCAFVPRKVPAGTQLWAQGEVPREALSFTGRLAHDMMARRVAAAGEPFHTFFDPADLSTRLIALGFTSVRDWTPDMLNARYFADRDDALRVSGQLGRIMTAAR